MAKLSAKLAQTTDALRVSWLVSTTIDQLGGLNRFAASVRDHFDDVSTTRHASRETLNALASILNLCAASATLNPPPNPDLMSDHELDEHMRSLFRQKLVENLEDVLLNLQSQGWRIEPPFAPAAAPGESNEVSTTARAHI